MKPSEIKKLIINSASPDANTEDIAGKLENEGVAFDFNSDFTDKVINRLFTAGLKVSREVEFVSNLSYAFKRIALTSVAAIVVLLISIFITQGSISLNSFLGLSDSYDESIVCLLTGN